MTSTPYQPTLSKLAELESYVGKELGLSNWVCISQERINKFADATDDHQWIHVDPERSALSSPYNKTIAHGFLVLSLASKFTYETYQIKDVVMGSNYGLDKVRFPNATPVDARLRGRVALIDFRSIPNGARFKLKVTFELEGEEKPACVAEFLGLAYTKGED